VAREPEELVDMRRVLGAQLAAFRQAAELSQGQLARVAVVDRTTVAHIEKGRSRGDERFWTVVDAKCRAGGALLAGFHAWEAAKQEHDVRLREAELVRVRARAQELRVTLAPQWFRGADHRAVPGGHEVAPPPAAAGGAEAAGPAGPLAARSLLGSLAGDVPAAVPEEIIGQLVRLLRTWVGAMNRRELLQLWGWAVGTAAIPVVAGLDSEEQERLLRAIASPGRVDERVIDHIEAVLLHCKHQEDTLGSRAVLNTVLAQRNLVQDLLADCPATLRPRLLSVYSDMSSSIGFYFLELNDFDNAWRYHDQARAAAHDADNFELGIYALCEMSYAASWQGKAHSGIDLAGAARSLVGRTGDPMMPVCVATQAARAYATDGQYKVCLGEFERAQETLISAGQARVESLAYWYHEGLIASEKSDCLLRLGRLDEAVFSAQAALTLFDESYVGSLAFCMLFLSNAHLQSREIDEAARVVGDAAGLAARIRSARLVKELHATRSRMRPWQSTPAVRVLDDQLASYGLVASSAG
jgi:tetratricopeptide (TPR) repeat protein/DNA-binding XRE family transcriptional regulator